MSSAKPRPPSEWFTLNPGKRDALKIQHPASFSEELVRHFLELYTLPGDKVFDPMAGTGSTLVGAMQTGRYGYGVELSQDFTHIARKRCNEQLDPEQSSFLQQMWSVHYEIIQGDIRTVRMNHWSKMDYVLTSPPYWDILNHVGPNQRRRRVANDLKTNYSDDATDLGNIDCYETFLEELVAVYLKVATWMNPGARLTIIVKNLKKKSRNYPLAWDLTDRLREEGFKLVGEHIWCQDERLFPYGMGRAFVTNTLHQYCLTFRR